MFNSSIKGSDTRRNKAATNESLNKNLYWQSCLFCGCNVKVSEAHLINGVNGMDYSQFGVQVGYENDLDVSSARNYIPLCGSLGDKGTCHDSFDRHKIAMLYNPFLRKFYLYSQENSVLHAKVLAEIPQQFIPYRRLLAVRAFKCGLENYDTKLLSLPNVQVLQDVASLNNSNSTSSSAPLSKSFGSDSLNSKYNGSKRKLVDISASDEERRRQRKERFSKEVPRQCVDGEHQSQGAERLQKGCQGPRHPLN
mmetsp:Transcript_1923/g.3055  ORF Transcript_1923/g.3055 Transcript_1923/m.3055 type:complete len:252 (-) Transcript_1923:5-760(-)